MAQQLKNILLVGGTGHLGSQIANALLDKKVFHVKILVRKTTLETKKDMIESFKSKGATVVVGETSNIGEMTNILKGVDTIVSAIGTTSIAEEKNLIAAAKASGSVKRFIPSEYGAEISKLKDPGFLAGKLAITEELKNSGIDYTIIVTGVFLEYLFNILEADRGIITGLGEGNLKFSSISTADIAKFVPEILLDPYSKNQVIRLVGQTMTPRQAETIYNSIHDKKVHVVPKDVATFKKEFESAPSDNMFAKFVAWLRYTMVINPGAVDYDAVSDNWRYPNIIAQTAKEFLLSQKKA